MNDLLQKLIKLQELEFGKPAKKSTESEKATLREGVPPQILGHFDRLVARGKKGVSIVRNQVCTGCHMRVPTGKITDLMRGEDIQLCEPCGRYLHLPDPGEADLQAQRSAPKSAAKAPAKPRKRRALATVV